MQALGLVLRTALSFTFVEWASYPAVYGACMAWAYQFRLQHHDPVAFSEFLLYGSVRAVLSALAWAVVGLAVGAAVKGLYYLARKILFRQR
jgi:hypothetical protein